MASLYLHIFRALLILAWCAGIPSIAASSGDETVKSEHSNIGMGHGPDVILKNTHPDAQWFGDAGLGLFIHWGIASVKAINISHPMIVYLPHGPMTSENRALLLQTKDFRGMDGKSKCVVPSEYFAQAEEFNPKDYDPEKWMKAAKEAGFTYAVLTAKHHEGFALWPSAYGDFSTKNHMGGRDLVKEWVEACRKNGLKVGLYYSGPDFHFDRETMNFVSRVSAREHPEFPALDANYNPRTTGMSQADMDVHQKAFAEMINGQITELMTRYGKIDLLWFDGGVTGAPDRGCGTNSFISLDRIRELQPGIIINPRMHKAGDFVTFERALKIDKPIGTWGELCDTWTTAWPHVEGLPFRAPHHILGNLGRARSLNVNYLLGVGPTRDGAFVPDIYQNMKIVGEWMRVNRDAVTKAKPLPEGESASVPATALDKTRYLFVHAENKGPYAEDLLPATDMTLTLSGVNKPSRIILTGDGKPLEFTYADKKALILLPASKRSTSVDVVKVEL